jgi:hypothetical protein
MRRWLVWIAVIAVLVLVAVVWAVAFWYQPLVLGSVGGHDDHLLIDARTPPPNTGEDFLIYEYRFHAGASYYTLMSVRNTGPLPVKVLGVDTSAALPMTPSIEPVELLNGSRKDDPFGTIDLAAATPLTELVVAPGSEVALWIHWEIGPCDPKAPVPYSVDSGVARSTIPLRWSLLGISRTTVMELAYTVAFQVTPEDLATECQPAATQTRGQSNS